MKTNLLFTLILAIALFACTTSPSGSENKSVQHDTIKSDYALSRTADTLIQNGEYIKYYKNGVIEMQGMMKDGNREGAWKSWHENGSPWSETTFLNGKKNGKTTTWYDNEKKRYEGFYTNDKESGHWTFWDETGKVQQEQDYK